MAVEEVQVPATRRPLRAEAKPLDPSGILYLKPLHTRRRENLRAPRRKYQRNVHRFSLTSEEPAELKALVTKHTVEYHAL